MMEQDNLEFFLEFITHNSIDLNYRLTEEYFNDGNFKAEGNFFQLEFKQGSKLKNGLVLNPLKWKSHFQITLDDNYVTIKGVVDPSNQFVSQTEIDCWNKFIINYKNSLLQRKNLYALNKAFVKSSKKSTFKYIWLRYIFNSFTANNYRIYC